VSGIQGFDHVRLAIPPGGEERARAFYAGVLGMREIPKPGALAERHGAWFVAGSASLHLGADHDFVPAPRTHPALQVDGLAALLERCSQAGHPPQPAVPFDGRARAFVSDPFGNRIELIERA
jgi:catechol 2,3-dioxygenase-like lactoylglutathione lyase family enzyme